MNKQKGWLIAHLAVFITAVAFSVYPASDPDLYIMLASGRHLLETGQIPMTDLWSHTAAGNPWMNHSWLGSLLFYLAYLAGGISGVIVFKSLVISGATAAGLGAARLMGAKPGAAFITAFLAILAASQGFAERAQVISYLMVSLLLLLLEALRSGRISPKAYYICLGAGFAVWANLHMGFLFGLMIIGAYLAESGWDGLKGRGWRMFWLHFGALALAVIATGLNPYGFRLTIFPFQEYLVKEEYAFSMFVIRTIHEYQPLFSGLFSREPFVKYGFFWLGFAVLGLVLNSGRDRVSHLLLALALGALSVTRVRYLWFCCFICLPAAAANWQLALAKIKGLVVSRTGRPQADWNRLSRLTLPTVVAGILLGLTTYRRSGEHLWQRVGWGWEPQMNTGEGVEFLKQNLRGSQIFNDFDIGGYLIWKRIPVFVDGRLSPYKNTTVLSDHFRIFEGELGLLDRYGLDWVFIPYGMTSGTARFINFNQRLVESLKWALVYWDDACLIYVRRSPKFADVVSSCQYRFLNPAFQDMSVPADSFNAELNQKLVRNPEQTAPHLLASNYWFARHDMARALEHLKIVMNKKPRDGSLYNNLGNIYLRLGRIEDAVGSYKKAVSLDVNMGLAYCNWGYVMETKGEIEMARELYLIATRVTPGDAWPYNRLGIIEANKGNIYQAKKYWAEGARIDPYGDAAKNLAKARGRP
jgi:Flp pilus assembly protein TadD